MSLKFALGVAVVAVAGVLAIVSRPVGAGDPPDKDYAKLMQEKAASVVTVKSVIKVSWSGGERERNDERIGAIVDPAGVIMMQNWLGTQMSASYKVSPMSIRVLFEGDEKEYDAVLGALDSKLGLAFIRVKDLAGKKLTAVNLADSVETKLGDEVFGVLRTDEGFDYAPYFGTGRIVGQVAKPRAMWLLTGFAPVGHPMYTPEGKVTGVVVRQSGISEEGSGERTFLLPVKTVSLVVNQAIKASAKALEDAKVHEAEAAAMADAPAMGDAPGMGDAAPPGMGDEPAPGMGEAPAGMDR